MHGRAGWSGRPSIAITLAITMLALQAAAPGPGRGQALAAPLVRDTFTRSAVSGWGTADSGHGYANEGNGAAFSVDGSAGLIDLARAGANRLAVADAVARDTDSLVRIQVDKLPAGGRLWFYLIGRRIGTSEYRPKLRITADGGVDVHAGVAVNNVESSLGPLVPVSGLTAAPGAWLWLRSQVVGADPTTVSVKAWADGSAEPADWQFTATNSAPGLQAAGNVGLRAYVSSIGNAPITVAVDDLAVDSLDALAEPAPVPSADFSWTQQADSLSVDFHDASTGPPTEWAWDFGDGSQSTEQNPTHTYATDGTYTASLTATNASGSDTVEWDVVVDPLPPPPPPPPPPPDESVVAADTFARSVTDSWSVAEVGSLYSYQGRLSDFSVDGSAARLRLPAAGATRSAFLLSTLAADVDLSFSVATDKPAAGAAQFVYASLRRTADGHAYRPKLRFMPNGNVFAHAGRLGSGGETSLGPAVLVSGLAHGPGTVIRFRAQVAGSNPTTIQVRAWADGAPEPDVWHFSATDSAAQLQGPGAVGLLAHAASGTSNTPVSFSLDDLLVTTTTPIERVAGETFVGAGDIARCDYHGDEATAALLDLIDGTIFTAGDNSQLDGTADEFANCYDPTWGRHKGRTYPALGNHEYHAAVDAAPYFDYFGAVAGERGKGWYAYDVGLWRIYVLNSNCGFVGCTVGSEQEQWLRADLAANARACSLAIWHHPRFSSATTHGSTPSVQPFWQALYEAGAEMVLSGHDHDYERFAPLDASGAIDQAAGVRQFVVGTGGTWLRSGFNAQLAATEVRQATSHGLLKLVLGEGEYEWEFIPIAGQTFTDRGSASCH